MNAGHFIIASMSLTLLLLFACIWIMLDAYSGRPVSVGQQMHPFHRDSVDLSDDALDAIARKIRGR